MKMESALFCRLVLIISILAGIQLDAAAEVVRVKTGRDAFGQGWMFVDRAGVCRVATPAHVVARGGNFANALVVDQKGREYPAVSAVQPDEKLDLAVLDVRGTSNTGPCTPSRLGFDNLAPRLSRLSDATMVTLDAGELRTIPVIQQARSLDQSRGKVFAIVPVAASQHFYKGMSGSIVISPDNIPMGMVIEVDPDDNIGVALRFDTIKRAISSDRTARKNGEKNALVLGEVSVLNGETIDPANGPAALVGEGELWRVKADGKQVRALIRMHVLTRLSEVNVALPTSADTLVPVAMEVATSADTRSERYYSAAYCRPSTPGAKKLACRFAPRQVRALRLTLVAANAGAVLSIGQVTVVTEPSR